MDNVYTTLRHLRAATALIAIAALCVMAAGIVHAVPTRKKQPNRKELRHRSNEVKKEISHARQRISLNDTELATALRHLQSLEADMAVTQASLDSLTLVNKRLGNESEQLTKQISTAVNDVEQMRAAYLRQIKQMRLHRGDDSGMAFLFSSKDFHQCMQRWRYMRQMARWRSRRVADITSRMAQLKERNRQLQVTQSAQTAALQQTRLRRNELEAGRRRQHSLAEQLRSDNQGLRKLISRKQNELASLDRMTSELIAAQRRDELHRRAEQQRQAEARRTAGKEAPASASRTERQKPAPSPEAATRQRQKPADSPPATTYAEARGRRPRSRQTPTPTQAVKPVPEPETAPGPAREQENAGGSGFGVQRGKLPSPVNGTFRIVIPFGHHSPADMPKVTLDNTGIDAEVAAGAAVKAVYDGKVAAIYKAPGFGTVVLLRHGEYYTVYANLSHSTVSSGQHLRQGQNLGVVAGGEKPTLHFEVWRQRTRLNPQEWLR